MMTAMYSRLWLPACGLGLAILLSPIADAQQNRLVPGTVAPESAAGVPPVPDTLEAGGVDAFVAPLTESQARQLLIDELRKQAQIRDSQQREMTRGGAVDLIQRLQQTSMALSTTTSDLFSALAALPQTGSYMFLNLTDAGGWPAMGRGLLAFVLLVGAGFGSRYYLDRVLRGVRSRLGQAAAKRWHLRLTTLGLRLALDLVSVAVFALTVFVFSFVFYQRFDPMRWFILTYTSVILITWLAWVFGRFLFAPRAAGIRLVPLADDDARRLNKLLVQVALAASLGAFSAAMLAILGLPAVLYNFVIALSGLAVVVILGVSTWSYRGRLTELIFPDPGARPGALRVPVAAVESWHLFAMLFLTAIWFIWATNVMLEQVGQAKAAALALVLVLSAPSLDHLIGWLLQSLSRFQLGEEPMERQHAGSERSARLVHASTRVVLAIVVLAALAEALGLGVVRAIQSPFGQVLFWATLNIGVTVLLGFFIWGFVSTAIDRHLPETQELALQEPGGEGGGAGGTRAETLLPLLRSFLFVVLVVIVTLVVLSSLGINIGPLLAGASIVGLAVGFGSQKLVQDIVAGIFFLVDDAFRVGEYIEAGGMKGTVESISIRSMRLRHHLGAVQTLPYGEIQAVKNHSRDWVIMKLEIRLPYEADIEKARKTIKKVGQQLLQDEELGCHFLQPLKSQGVFRVEESALIIRMKFTAVPGEQWVIRREAYRRVRDALLREGIRFAHREVTVRLPEDKPEDSRDTLTEAAGAAVGASLLAASETARQSDPDMR